jgi:hypothetical protein
LPLIERELTTVKSNNRRNSGIFLLSALLVSVLMVGHFSAHAQRSSATALPAISPTAPFQASQPIAPKVIMVEGHLELDTIISVEVDHLNDWAAKNDASKLIPYLDGRPINGNYPAEVHTSTNRLQFHLQITAESREVWKELLGQPQSGRKAVSFSVGLENQNPFDSVFDKTAPLWLTVISPPYMVVSLIVVLVSFFLLIWLARKTNLVRDSGSCPVVGKLRPYNLGRVQMAFWFFLIYAAYVTVWLITASPDRFSVSLLTVMGISAATALSETLNDSRRPSTTAQRLQELSLEKESLERTIPEIQTQINERAKSSISLEDAGDHGSLNSQLQNSRAHLGHVINQIQELSAASNSGVSNGFFRDILSDSSGYGVERFQFIACSIVLGILFISSVYDNLAMPEFSVTLLGLMGISSATYIVLSSPRRFSSSRDNTGVREESRMRPHQFNTNRLTELEELLDIEYAKLHEFEKELALADGIAQRVQIRQQIKRQITPRLRELEHEYAEMLAKSVPTEGLPEEEAELLVLQLNESVIRANAGKPDGAPQEMVRLLTQINDKLNEPGKSASTKLKLTLPIIPLISSYEMELDTERFLTQAWRRIREFFQQRINYGP